MNNKYNFDKLIERRKSGCRKWDGMKEIFGKDDLLPLWIADMDFEPPIEVLDAIKNRADHTVFGYPTIETPYYTSLINWVKKRHGLDIKKEWIINTPGVVPALGLAVLSLTDEGDGIIIQPPVYPPFFESIKGNNRELIENPLINRNGRYEIDFEDLERKASLNHVKMIILCNPHNPVGRVWTRNELLRINEICLRNGVAVVSDEIHSDLSFRSNPYTPVLSLGQEISRNTLTALAPSKTFNIAGLFTSVIVIPDEEKRRRFSHLINVLHLGKGNIFGINALEAAYAHGEEWLGSLLSYIEGNAEYTVNFIKEKMPSIKLVKPEGTYLAWIDFRDIFAKSSDLKKFLIEDAKVALNDGLSFGSQGEGFARLNFGCPRLLLEEGLNRIENALKKHIK